jgi:hypothetical protein
MKWTKKKHVCQIASSFSEKKIEGVRGERECMCVCVRERERERKQKSKRACVSNTYIQFFVPFLALLPLQSGKMSKWSKAGTVGRNRIPKK